MILLDTHVLIWLASEPGRLSKKATDAIRRASQGTGIGISAITLWEIAWLAIYDRLEVTGTVEAFVDKIRSRTAIEPITEKVAVLANQLNCKQVLRRPSEPARLIRRVEFVGENVKCAAGGHPAAHCRLRSSLEAMGRGSNCYAVADSRVPRWRFNPTSRPKPSRPENNKPDMAGSGTEVDVPAVTVYVP